MLQHGCLCAVVLHSGHGLGLPLGLEAPVMTPNSVIFSFSFIFRSWSRGSYSKQHGLHGQLALTQTRAREREMTVETIKHHMKRGL